MLSSNRPQRIEDVPAQPDSGYAVVRHARRVIAAVLGGTVIAIGVAMLVLPGPGFLVLF
ncbi:MAG: PGPGW domain-containing protein, partial [Candidatus Binatia bacterium]